MGGLFISILLPKASKLLVENDKKKIENFVYSGTIYTTIIVNLLCFPLILNSSAIIGIYVGSAYSELDIWLSIWLLSIVMYLHNSPVASLVLSTGKTKMLIYSSAVASITSLIVNATLVNIYGVGAAVIGYLTYIIIQMSFYYLYFNNVVLGLNSNKVFKAFIKPTTIGIITYSIIMVFKIDLVNQYTEIIVNSVLWLILYGYTLHYSRVISFNDIYYLYRDKLMKLE
jgi:O-antigen/teichoic acid export membrane protein